MAARVIAHYEIVRQLGAGGMGEVYLAQDTRLERLVALKVMSAELAKEPNQRKRFRTEAKAASGLSHPHICVIHEVGETEEGRPYLAMEYVEGQTLEAVMRERRLKAREVVQLGIDVAEALEAAHGRGLVHRDIKPANLMLDQRGEVKVMDFGLAKRFGADELSSSTTSVAQTRTGMLIGTPQYMSPEQALGRALEPRSDIFSLGVVLYEMVAGQRPFLGSTVGETINAVVNQAPAALGLDDPVFSPALERIIFKCLGKEPEKRYATARELADDLRRLKEDSERALTATTQQMAREEATVAAGERQPTALWQLAGKADAGHRKALAWMIGVVLVVSLGVAGWALLRPSGRKPLGSGSAAGAAEQKSVAVLPFVNLSADKGDEYLSDGMTEELLNALTKIKGLRVPGRSSSFAFKGKTEEGIFRKVGQQLAVEAVLEGSVRKSGNQLRITAQLINVADGFHLWSDTYDRDMTNIFAIQSDIASRVAEALKVQLLGAVSEPTGDIEAYKLYLQGRYLWNRRTGETIRQAIERFNAAITLDSKYAPAYEGLAHAYALLPIYAKDAPEDARDRTRAAALKALELEPHRAGAVAALAALKDGYEWDWEGAEAEYRRAIELDPKYATARQWFAESLSMRGRSEEAERQAREAVALDPLSPMINAVLGRVLLTAGKAEESMAVLRKQLAVDPSFAPAHVYLGWGWITQGKFAEAAGEFETVNQLDEENPRGDLGFCYARLGRTNEAQRALRHLLEVQRQGRDVNIEVAVVYHGLGEEEQAFAALEKAAAEHSPRLQMVVENPCWKDACGDPRFQAVLRKMNLGGGK